MSQATDAVVGKSENISIGRRRESGVGLLIFSWSLVLNPSPLSLLQKRGVVEAPKGGERGWDLQDVVYMGQAWVPTEQAMRIARREINIPTP